MPDSDPGFSDWPEVVLDTNVVLDWLVFDDPTARPLAEAIRSGRWRWIGTEDTLRELATVLSRPALARWQSNRRGTIRTVLPPGTSSTALGPEVAFDITPPHPALTTAQRLCQRVATPLVGGIWRLTCTDADDQKFIDLAVARRVRWLFSRDKAVLRLTRRARTLGVRVLRPGDWPQE